MNIVTYIDGHPVTKDDLAHLKKMSEVAKQFATLHSQLSNGCSWVAFDMHNEDSSVNHLAKWIEKNTDELANRLEEAFNQPQRDTLPLGEDGLQFERPDDPHLLEFHKVLQAGYKGSFYEWHKEHFGSFWCPT